jgi:deoxyribodipyrimidine photolyase-related protein
LYCLSVGRCSTCRFVHGKNPLPFRFMSDNFTTLRLLLGDQLNEQHSWFAQTDPQVLYVLMEIRSETDYVPHHIQKVMGFFGAMRLFAQRLQDMGHQLRYFRLDDADNQHTFADNCAALMTQYGIQRFEYQLPDEYRVDEHLMAFCLRAEATGVATKAVDSEHFMAERFTVKHLFSNKKTYVMEAFYRKMREKYQILMEPDGKTPLTGRWNYDAENRKKMPPKEAIPPALSFHRDLSEVQTCIEAAGVKTIGQVDASRFDWPLTRAESLALLAHFAETRLSLFGAYQDAMTPRDWLLFHSRLSFSMNIKLISPREVIDHCVACWERQPEVIPFSGLEGFVRQILGWREYMRGIYWAEMPNYKQLNFFEHQAALPVWFWTGDTQMNCLRHAVGQSLEHAYAHHIQRLMVTGSFALLLGVHPDEVDQWYLGIYMDALEWVEITNTRGMSQYADGGIVGTKPYAGSANYMDKMSDYCTKCHYDKSLRYGHRACPFNSLYWDFYDRHRDKLAKNPRIGMMYPLLNKMAPEELAKIKAQAALYKEMANEL